MIYVFCRAVVRGLFAILYRFESVGVHNIPSEGGVLICSNHLSVRDPISVGIHVKRQVKFMAKAELFKIPVFGWLIDKLGAFPVKRGGVSKESIKTALTILRQGEVMGIFPEGTRNSDATAAKRGAASFALRSGATVIPAAIIGDYKLFRKVKIIYGAPVDLSRFEGDKSPEALDAATEIIMSKIHEMRATGKPTVNG
ncbi:MULTISPECIES: lysophospholipid acyltransferase family protein [Paenibacillus]|uniref:Phospholipid/glycerol acyltransferase n=3 Tax=Paenibacillus TaxID=44249 RepID=G4HF72_9BACL|nr:MULTISPECIES: lysophospholipid acyltransferase family protein [Paenibacillus]EHB64389.1 phospholipid/glycerol acyltransferase [Paenibacillus lactis 154]MBP1892914.1 1-acyl-sn-glycerol-3-phosphate acyltransferase [Paenibacillus lactis]MCM3495227.1 1-acyl-sn-glycerol-3-phosphate acyltransferase [Paenibacillus lactis]GIO91855.1 1-acyl-sn-glycerol-3-phosphate acyltransferase [Paenibacillus lactis]HAF97611.1 1-acyl-sn-glycerol-3-phosphate acyltransferase [Paenibacillus lactis]